MFFTMHNSKLLCLIRRSLFLLLLFLVCFSNNNNNATAKRLVLEQYTFHIDEGLPPNTPVGQIPNKSTERNPRYSFIRSHPGFALTASGELITNQVFDHEELTKDQKEVGFSLQVSRGVSGFVMVTIKINDINDNRPVFPVKTILLRVSEDLKPADDIAFPNARDPDTHQEVTYRIERGDPHNDFMVRRVNKADGSRYVLALKEDHFLDVETKEDNYTLVVSACELISKKCSSLQVQIAVDDVNDNSPVFDKGLPGTVDVFENASLSVPFYRVKATDADRGKNGQVEFSLFSNNGLRIDPVTGDIYAATPSALDSEANVFISLLIIAKDKGTPVRNATFFLLIKIVDCNDMVPKLTIHPATNRAASLVEGSPAGAVLGSLTIIDLDKDVENNQITKVTLESGGNFFQLERTEDEQLNGHTVVKYFIKTIKDIDREVTPSILLSVSATDSGLPPLTGRVNYTVQVIDKNDNAPIFEQNVYETQINESAEIGARVVQVRAHDLDAGENGRVSYSIASKDDLRWFTIDQDTGIIRLTEYIDREQQHTDSVLIRVRAQDNGINALANMADVKVTVLDSNDNDPKFVSQDMEFSLEENNLANARIGKMAVRDADIIGSDHLTCYIDHKAFRVDAASCQIYANTRFDREETSEYVLTAVVKDGLGRSSSGRVVVSIIDQNDNMPKFVKPFFNISVHTNFPDGHNAAFIEAVDPDATDNSQFSAHFEKHDDFYFKIDTYTGGIKLLTNLTKINKTVFTFTAYVTDRKNPQPKTADHARIQLNVLPPSVHPPIFEKLRYEFSIAENNKAGALVGKVRAVRPISNSNIFINYRITSGNAKRTFEVGRFGALRAARPINYEEQSRYELVVEAEDNLELHRVANVTIVVNVIDLNDNVPRFINRNNVVTVKEGVAVGHLLYTCRTEDLDSGDNGRVVYSIKRTTGHFVIHQTSGDVRTNGSLDFETSESHVIYVVARDQGTPSSHSAEFKIEVKVQDENDNSPLFHNSSQIVRVAENNAVDKLILTLNASDADAGDNGKFYFTLVPNEDSKSFKLLRGGQLYVMESLDREAKSSYSLRAQVKDFGIPAQMSEAVVTVIVDDENDEAPKFQKQFYQFSVSEELQPGTIVGEVVAVDADTGENGKFTYYLRDQNKDKFEIETRHMYKGNSHVHVCIIKTKTKFDSEANPDSYNITIGASDHGMNGNSNEVSITITIQNINDHPPEFTRTTPYVACVNAGTNAQHKVIQVSATDRDQETVPLTYSFVSFDVSHDAARAIFSIDPDTGIIRTSLDIDNEIARNPVYEMVVCVQELGATAQRSYTNYQKVVVFVSPKPAGLFFKETCPHVVVKSSTEGEQLAKNNWDVNFMEYSELKYGITAAATAGSSVGKMAAATGELPFSILSTTGIVKVSAKYSHASYYRLNVTAEANNKQNIRYTEWILFSVYVVPKNMYPPSYPNNLETYHVTENYPINKPIGILKSPYDRDKGMEGKCIFSIENSVGAPVKVSPLTGELVFTEPIDREKNDKIVVKIRVSDLAEELPLRLSNTLTVAIHITDVNDNAPQFDSKRQVDVLENVRPDTVIHHVHAVDPDAGATQTGIEYDIVGGNSDAKFKLDRLTGALRTTKRLSIRERASYSLHIIAMEIRNSDGVGSSAPGSSNGIQTSSTPTNVISLNTTFSLDIRVLDVNDQKPRFVKEVYTAHVKENRPIGTEVIGLQSTDDDSLLEYKEVTYGILEKNSGFYIDEKNGTIRTSIKHDRERRNAFLLNVIVRNVAAPHGEDTCEVRIIIDDVNDNPPIFTGGDHQELFVMENSLPVPRPFHRLRYTDADGVANSRVTFSVVSFEKPEPSNKAIRLDEQTGEFWLDHVLDREQRSVYVLTVEARNTKAPHHSARQKVTIFVDDENDEDPVFEEKVYCKSVFETQKVNQSPVLTVKAVDADIGSNAIVEYTLAEGTDQEVTKHFTVDRVSGDIFLTVQLDYEQQKFYQFQVKATGSGLKSFDVATVEIQVQDENDNKPVFSSTIYEFSVPKVQVNHVIGSVIAKDRDRDGEQQILYQFDPFDAQFGIDSATGEIRITSADLIHGQYRLHVIASDIGLHPTLKSQADIVVKVGSADDKILRFVNSSVVFSIDENPPQNMWLGKILAVSGKPSTASEKVSYQINPVSNPDHAFRINRSTGDLYVNNSQSVDYERRTKFFLGILSSTSDPKATRFLSVLVNLIDINDNTPFFLVKNITIDDLRETDIHPFVDPLLVYSIHVRDDDKVDQANLNLEIVSGNEDGLFYIRPWRGGRGRLYLIKNLDYEKKSRHHLVVRVTDRRPPFRYADSHIYFIVEDVNDNKPIFDKIEPVFVSEASQRDTMIAQLRAVDKDKTKTDIKYSIRRDGGLPLPKMSLFEIDEVSGKVFLAHPLDYETSHRHTLHVSAFDGVHRTYGELVVNVVDVNDHSPRFTKSIYTVKNVFSVSKKGQFVVKVDATDLDHGDFGIVKYKLEPSRDPFFIEQDSGKIFTNKEYKFEPGVVKLTVVAYDSPKHASGSRSSTAVVEIHITQVQSAKPTFKRNIYQFSIEEHTPDGVVIGYVEAIVLHGYRDFVYRIVDGNDGDIFTIDQTGGAIRTNRDLDRETKSRYTLHLVAEVTQTNIGGAATAKPSEQNEVTAKCIVKIVVLDINDNQPEFEKSYYYVTQYENIKIGTKLLQMKATDADDPKQPYGKLVYSIFSGQEGTQWLRINETDGTVETNMVLDRERTDMIRVTIRVADVVGTGMETFASLNVTVLDMNDNAPDFKYNLDPFNDIRIKENMPPHTKVFKATAYDKDKGENGRISYKIYDKAGSDIFNLFYMNDSIPGWVYTKASLDFEKVQSYKLTVLAYDHGVSKKEASMEYVIEVDDENEYAPVFKNAGGYSFEMFGDLEVGSVIGNISATDKDGGSAGVIKYSIHPSNFDSFAVHINTGVVTVNKDLKRYRKITNSVQLDDGEKRKKNEDFTSEDNTNDIRRRKRRSFSNINYNNGDYDQRQSSDEVEDIRFQIRADNGPNTAAVATDIVVRVNYTCPGCVIYTVETAQPEMKGATTTVVVAASIAVFLILIFLIFMGYFLRKKGCFNRHNHATPGFCTSKKETDLSNSVERELLNSGASSLDRLQHFYSNGVSGGEHVVEKSQVSSETGLLADGTGSGTARSVSAADKASTYSFGIYHEQGKTDSEMQHRLGETLSEMTLIKELEDDSVFGYSSGKMKSEPTKSLISRSTQESSLYSLSSTAVHRNGFNFIPRPTSNKIISANRSDSHESLKDFMEEGGGEAAGGMDVGNLLYAKLAEVNEDERDAIMESVRPFQEEGRLSYGGSFSTIIGSDEELNAPYNNRSYSNDSWKQPPYQQSHRGGSNSIFSEIAGGRKSKTPSASQHRMNYSSYNPKDVITNNAVAAAQQQKQPLLHEINMNNRLHFSSLPPVGGLKLPPKQQQQQNSQPVNIPLQVLNSGRTSRLSSVTSLPRLPQELQSTYTSGILSPNFTPAFTPLVFRSPSVSSIGTQDEYSNNTPLLQQQHNNNNNKSRTASYEPVFNTSAASANLRRSDSRASQLSRITLSDLEISDNEIGV